MEDFIRVLHEEGPFGYFWSNKKTTCYKVDGPLPKLGDRRNVYFGVNPVRDWLPPGRRGGEANVSAMSALFADFDAKSYVPIEGVDLAPYEKQVRDTYPKITSPAAIARMASDKYRLERFMHDRKPYLALLAKKLPLLPLAPSYLVYTGGGAHAYWLLKQPFIFQSQADQVEAKELLMAWVKLIGADPAAASMDRVLRVPETLNTKYDPPVMVRIRQQSDVRYSAAEIKETIADFAPPDFESKPVVAKHTAPAPTAPVVRQERTYKQDDKPIWEYFNERYSPVDILLRNGYEARRTNGQTDRYARPGGATDSVTIFDGKISYHHSSSDPLFWGNYEGHGHDAFRLFTELEHGGDVRAAAKAARAALGLTSARFTSRRGPSANVETYSPDGEPARYEGEDFEVDDRDFERFFGVPIEVKQSERVFFSDRELRDLL